MGIEYNNIIVTDGLVMCIDAANTRSYSGSGITVNGLVGGIGGTLVNGVGFTSSYNGSFVFDGTNDNILAQDNSALNLTSDLTACVWFRISAVPANDWVRVIGKGDMTNRTFGFWYYNGTPDYFLYQRYGSGNFGILIDTTLQLNVWYHAAVTSNNTSHIMYINGISIGTATLSPPFLSSTSPLRIGYGEIHSYHNGNISHALVYNRALSASEVLQNYNATKGRYR
jgi:hypothetical protein